MDTLTEAHMLQMEGPSYFLKMDVGKASTELLAAEEAGDEYLLRALDDLAGEWDPEEAGRVIGREYARYELKLKLQYNCPVGDNGVPIEEQIDARTNCKNEAECHLKRAEKRMELSTRSNDIRKLYSHVNGLLTKKFSTIKSIDTADTSRPFARFFYSNSEGGVEGVQFNMYTNEKVSLNGGIYESLEEVKANDDNHALMVLGNTNVYVLSTQSRTVKPEELVQWARSEYQNKHTAAMCDAFMKKVDKHDGMLLNIIGPNISRVRGMPGMGSRISLGLPREIGHGILEGIIDIPPFGIPQEILSNIIPFNDPYFNDPFFSGEPCNPHPNVKTINLSDLDELREKAGGELNIGGVSIQIKVSGLVPGCEPFTEEPEEPEQPKEDSEESSEDQQEDGSSE